MQSPVVPKQEDNYCIPYPLVLLHSRIKTATPNQKRIIIPIFQKINLLQMVRRYIILIFILFRNPPPHFSMFSDCSFSCQFHRFLSFLLSTNSSYIGTVHSICFLFSYRTRSCNIHNVHSFYKPTVSYFFTPSTVFSFLIALSNTSLYYICYKKFLLFANSNFCTCILYF